MRYGKDFPGSTENYEESCAARVRVICRNIRRRWPENCFREYLALAKEKDMAPGAARLDGYPKQAVRPLPHPRAIPQKQSGALRCGNYLPSGGLLYGKKTAEL
jgi:hypothetical protein